LLKRDEIYVEGLPADAPSSAVLHFVERHAGRRVLDIGCGYGAYALALAREGREVAGIELNSAYVAEARRRGLDVTQGDASATPFADDAFDTALLVEVLEHVQDAEPVLREALRVAREVLVTVPNVGEYDSLGRYGLTYWHLVTTDHVRFFTADGLAELAARCGASATVARAEPLEPFGLVRERGPAWFVLAVLRRLGVIRPVAFARLYAVVRRRPA
jgi:SAM-dependent methyltransferase